MVFLRVALQMGAIIWFMVIPSVADTFQNNTAGYDQHDTQIYFSVTRNDLAPLNACL